MPKVRFLPQSEPVLVWESALSTAADIAELGDVVLLAPGGTSFDEFIDFEERGRFFREWVAAL